MSGFGPPRFPQRPRGPFPFDNPRFPPLNPPPQQYSTSFRPRHPQGNGRGSDSGRGFAPFRGQFEPRGRFSTPYRRERPYFGNRGRSRGRQGYHGNRGFRGSHGQGIESYYNHSMVEDPWKELEETYRKQNQEHEASDS